MDIKAIEKRFANLAALWDQQSIQVLTFEDKARQEAFHHLGRIQKSLNIDGLVLPNLGSLLAHIHWDLRGYLAPSHDAKLHWDSRIEELNYQIASSAHALGSEARDSALSLRRSLETLRESDEHFSDALSSHLFGKRTLIVTEKDRQRASVGHFVSLHTDVDAVDIVQLQSFFRLDTSVYEQVLILAAPKRLSDNYMRALLLGGATSKAKFLCANWLAGHEPQKVVQDLVPGLPGVKKPVFTVVGPVLLLGSVELENEIFEAFQDGPQQLDYETYSGGGSLDCRVVKLAKGYIMPVEAQAKKVSVLSTGEDGDLVVQYRIPGKSLEVGDILFELRDGAEEDFLMDQAQISMGISFHEFAKGRTEWKRRVSELVAAEGKNAVIRKLKASGVKTANYLDDWLENVDFTTPRAKKDWHNLLLALNFTDQEISRLEALGSDLRANLIAVGQKARGYMAEAVTSSDLERIRNSEIVTKQLDGFGDAVFILAMVEDPDAGPSTCQPHELRKVLRV
jgi:hypothetical protein